LKVLFANDLAETALVAHRLLVSLTWPRGAQIEVMHVGQPRGSKSHAAIWRAWENTPDSAEKAVTASAHGLDAQLAGREVSVSRSLRLGDPATLIVERAAEIGADLVVVGSRARGPLVNSALGTVSAAVVNRAPCSVLVARTELIRGLVLVDDGNTSSQAAVGAILGGSLFDAVHVTVVRVVDLHIPLGEGLFQERTAYEHRDRRLASRIKQASSVVEKRVAGLRASGRMALGRVLQGDTATGVVSAARGVGADLIVMGARDRGPQGQGRMDEVQRSVLLGFRGSVLIARSHATTSAPPPHSYSAARG